MVVKIKALLHVKCKTLLFLNKYYTTTKQSYLKLQFIVDKYNYYNIIYP